MDDVAMRVSDLGRTGQYIIHIYIYVHYCLYIEAVNASSDRVRRRPYYIPIGDTQQ